MHETIFQREPKYQLHVTHITMMYQIPIFNRIKPHYARDTRPISNCLKTDRLSTKNEFTFKIMAIRLSRFKISKVLDSSTVIVLNKTRIESNS